MAFELLMNVGLMIFFFFCSLVFEFREYIHVIREEALVSTGKCFRQLIFHWQVMYFYFQLIMWTAQILF